MKSSRLLQFTDSPVSGFGQLSINTVSFFTSTTVDVASPTQHSTDFIAAINSLKIRLLEIVKCNPWLIGKCERPNDTDEFIFHYTDIANAAEMEAISETDISKIFNVVYDDTFISSLIYEDMLHTFRAFTVKPGLEIANSDNNVFQITIIQSSSTEFAMIMSLSHMIADGHNYYQIWNMLSPLSKSPIISLSFDRKLDAHLDEFLERRIKDDGLWLKNRFESYFAHIFVNNKLAEQCSSEPMTKSASKIYKVNMSRIEDMKRSHIPTVEVPYITTNDVLVSMLAKWKNAEFPNMVVNLRDKLTSTPIGEVANTDILVGKIPNADLLVGNYIAAIQLDSWEVSTPEQLRRRVLADFCRNSDKCLPDVNTCPASNIDDILFTTSWHSFYDGNFKTNGYKMTAHYPFMETLFSKFVIIFRMSGDPGDVGIMCCDNSAVTNKTTAAFEINEPLGDLFVEVI